MNRVQARFYRDVLDLIVCGCLLLTAYQLVSATTGLREIVNQCSRQATADNDSQGVLRPRSGFTDIPERSAQEAAPTPRDANSPTPNESPIFRTPLDNESPAGDGGHASILFQTSDVAPK